MVDNPDRNSPDNDPLTLHEIPDAASVVHVTVERLFRLLKGQMAETLGHCGSGIVEWRILLMLRIHGEMAQKDLVAEVAMAQAQVSRTLTTLQARGLVLAKRSERDRRITLFRLSESGRALYGEIAPSMAVRKHALDSALPAEDLQAFLDFARRIARVAAAPVSGRDDGERTTAEPDKQGD